MLKYKLKSKNEYDIHSPFLFDFASKVLYEKTPYYPYQLIENIREKLLLDPSEIEIHDFGAGSKIFKSNTRKIKAICKHSVKPPKYGQLMFRMINYFQPVKILELGTSLGITTAYMACASKSSEIVSIEGDPATCKLARNTLKLARVNNVTLVNKTFNEALPEVLEQLKNVDFVFIDGHHSKKPTLSYFESCLQYSHPGTIFVFDDISWSAEMREAWEVIKSRKEVSLTIDLYFMGIVFLKEGVSKQDFVLKF